MKSAMNLLKTTMTMLVLLAAFGCNGPKGPVGTWANDHLPETVQFMPDHTGVFVVRNQPSLPFRWLEVDKVTVKLDVSIQGSVKALYGRRENGAFVIESNGQMATYHKLG